MATEIPEPGGSESFQVGHGEDSAPREGTEAAQPFPRTPPYASLTLGCSGIL